MPLLESDSRVEEFHGYYGPYHVRELLLQRIWLDGAFDALLHPATGLKSATTGYNSPENLKKKSNQIYKHSTRHRTDWAINDFT